MPTEYVVDASAIAKLFLAEEHSDAFRDWWYASLARGTEARSPSLLRFEIGNIVQRNLGHLDPAQRRRAWREALAGVSFDDKAIQETFALAALTFYDAAYVSLAKARRARLVTYDRPMRNAAEASGVRVVSPGA